MILPTAPNLTPAYGDQDQVFSGAFSVLTQAIGDGAFPAAAIAVTQAGGLIALKALGSFVFASRTGSDARDARWVDGGGGPDLTSSTLFDLASLTKPIATAASAMLVYERGQLDLDAPAAGLVPEIVSKSDPRRADITFRMLLAHSSGLPAYEKLFLKHHSRDELLQAAFGTPLRTAPGTRAEYSDIGFILLAVALERLAGETLDNFCRRELFSPLGMRDTTFLVPATRRPKIPPTADERENSGVALPRERTVSEATSSASPPKPRSTFRNRIIQGEVQDENAWVLGGVAGHAGLFSTSEDVARFAHCMLQGGYPILRPDTVALFTRRESTPAGTSRTLGWDTPTFPSQSGRGFGSNSYGHLGYTGTSLWIDPARQLSVTLLTNRTWPDCANQAIQQVRPRFHDAIVSALDQAR